MTYVAGQGILILWLCLALYLWPWSRVYCYYREYIYSRFEKESVYP